MLCPYNGFNECEWEECAARMLVKDISPYGYLMKVCAIAYNGGQAPKPPKGENT